MKSGIYTITNTVDNKLYIGYGVSMKDRWNYHRDRFSQLQMTGAHNCLIVAINTVKQTS